MVYLCDLKNQWPWNSDNEDYSDKEIYTHRVSVEDASSEWRVPVLPPLDGYAYTGIRVSVYGKDTHYTFISRLVRGETDMSVFGMPWDNTLTSNGSWCPLGFPLTHKMIALTEDGLDLLMEHPEDSWGQVSLVAQRFEDLLEDESDIAYAFLNHRTDKVEWILNKDNVMYKPSANNEPVYQRKTKLIPSIRRLLDNKRNQWNDKQDFWNAINIPAPLLV